MDITPNPLIARPPYANDVIFITLAEIAIPIPETIIIISPNLRFII